MLASGYCQFIPPATRFLVNFVILYMSAEVTLNSIFSLFSVALKKNIFSFFTDYDSTVLYICFIG
jgi:hypothetical protein